jgi:hypothetical protein
MIVRATIDAKTPERSLCSSPRGTGQTAGVSFVSGESQGQVERWSVVLDGRTVKQGEVMPYSRPDSIDVPLSGALRLELRMIAEPEFEGTIAWGDARVH